MFYRSQLSLGAGRHAWPSGRAKADQAVQTDAEERRCSGERQTVTRFLYPEHDPEEVLIR